MGNSFVSDLLGFLKEEEIKMKVRKTSDSEFRLESPEGFMAVKFVTNEREHEILYDVFSPKYSVHLRKENRRDVERLDLIAEETGKWEYEESIENLWLILDCVKLWAQKKVPRQGNASDLAACTRG
jgi:hypothetical protein